MNNVVVFGGTGEVGQIVVEKLLEQGSNRKNTNQK